jgi:hypothetical protein
MTKKRQETMLTEVAGKIGSTLGMIAAEASKVVRPLKAERRKQSRTHTTARKRRARAAGRPMRRNRTMRKRSRRSA